jgi:DNA invertase Pin-like site-specific DNA recombinase
MKQPKTKPPDRSKPIAAYIRVSSETQNPALQREAIGQWIVAQGIEPGAVAWYEDVASGRDTSRPEFDRLQLDIVRGVVRTVVVYKLDRISRTMFEGFDLIRTWCEQGVRIVSTTQLVDLTGVIGQMIAAVIMGISEIEWEYRRDRQRAGIELAKARGVKWGPEVGKFKGRRVKVTPDQEKLARRLKAEGAKVAAIARATGLTRPTVYSILGETEKARERSS